MTGADRASCSDDPAPTGPSTRSRRWWGLLAVALVAGSLAGVALARAARPDSGRPAAGQQIANQLGGGGGTSSGDVFDKGDGQHAAAWTLPDLRHPGAELSLARYRGRPLVLNFWASWCPPCRKEMPALAAVARHLSGRVDFVGVDTNDQRSAALAFAAHTGVAYPLAYDAHGNVAGTYGVYGLPTTFFISSTGVILGRQVGGMSKPRLQQLIQQTFG